MLRCGLALFPLYGLFPFEFFIPGSTSVKMFPVNDGVSIAHGNSSFLDLFTAFPYLPLPPLPMLYIRILHLFLTTVNR
jgi:hypothetical protein